jgi:hypothetical protein
MIIIEPDPSVGGSRPHGFAVREGITRQLMPPRPSHPASHVRDDREAPLLIGGGTHQDNHMFLKNGRQMFLGNGLDITSV